MAENISDDVNNSFRSIADSTQEFLTEVIKTNRKLVSTVEDLVENIQTNTKKIKKNTDEVLDSVRKNKTGKTATSKSNSGFDFDLSGIFNFDGLKSQIKKNFKSFTKQSLDDPTKALLNFEKFASKSFTSIGRSAKTTLTNPVAMFLLLVSQAIDRFLMLEKAAEDFRRQVGLAGDQTVDMERMAQRLSVQYENMGVSVENIYKSMSAIVEEFGRTDMLSDSLVKNISLFSSALGISEKSSAGFTKNISMIGGLSFDAASNFQATAYNLSKMSGVAPVKVIEDMANASDDTLIAFAGMPDKLLSASIYARRLGTDINELSKSTRGLLNFQSSISAEMEASTLLGKNLNLQRARQLRFTGDVKGANEEILNVVSKIGDFNKLNVFQQESIAAATGKSVGELQKQLMLREKSLKYGKDLSKLDEEAKNALMSSTNLNKDRLDQIIRESDLRSDQTKMMTELSSLGSNLAQILVPVITIISSVLTPILKTVGALVRAFFLPIQQVVEEVGKMSDGMGKNVDLVGSLIKGATFVGDILGKIVAFAIKFSAQMYIVTNAFKILSILIPSISKPFAFIKTLFVDIVAVGLRFLNILGVSSNTLSKFVSHFSKISGILLNVFKVSRGFFKFIPVIGWIVFGVEALIRLGKELFNIWSSSGSLMDKLTDSFKAIPMAIIKTFLSPFKIVLDWIGKAFRVENMGSLIIDGIIKAFDGLYDILLYPFKAAWNWMSETFFGKSPSKLGLNILKGISSVQGMITDVLLAPFRIAKDFIGEVFGSIFGGNNKTDISLTASDQLSSNLIIVSDALNKLTSSINTISQSNLLSIDNIPKRENVESIIQEDSKVENNVVVAKLDELIMLMKNGAISVNLDGRKVSMQLARKVY
jgi:hypothetical protein